MSDEVKTKRPDLIGNQYALGNKGGRPPKYSNVEEMQVLIDAYFLSCHKEIWINHSKVDKKTGETINNWQPVLDRDGSIKTEQIKPYTVTGLAASLGMTRQGLVDYSNKDEFTDTIKAAKSKIEQFSEETLYTARNPVGAIFNLKNNWGWKDKHETDVNLAGGVTIKWEE